MRSSFQVVKQSISWVYINKGLISFVFTPFLTFLVITSILTNISPLLFFLAFYILMWLFTTGMVQVHRTILLNEKQPKKLFPKIEKVYFKYFGLWFLISIITNITNKIGDMFFTQLETNFNWGLLIFGVMGILISQYLIIRAYFVFPSISIGNKLEKTFSFSKGYFWQTFKVLLIFIIPYFILVIVIALLFFMALGAVGSNIVSFLIYPFLFFIYFFSLMLINILYSFMLKEFTATDAILGNIDPR